MIGCMMIAAAHYTLLFVIAFRIVLPDWSGGYIMLLGSFFLFLFGFQQVDHWLEEFEIYMNNRNDKNEVVK